MLRADALATLYVFHPLRKALRPSEGRLPILMYHSISASTEERSHPYYRTVTTPDVFALHMKQLREDGYCGMSVSDALSSLEADRHPSGRPVAITFDDGYDNFYSEAFPILRKYGFSATMYLPTAYIGETPRTFKGIECLTWGQVRKLQTAGIEFGSHTATHPQLKSLAEKDVEREVRTSKNRIEQELGCQVKSFAYPYAFPETDRSFTAGLRGMLGQAGYENGVSTVIGTADRTDDRFFMKRLPMNACDDAPLFRAKLAGAYNWLRPVQYVSKLMSVKRVKRPCT
jgi:peptidoglycan/xylan/chitin deacetylase (PgdA/CDA1 family)